MSEVAAEPGGRRADARQNRERILQAADIVLQRDGINASLDAIFQEAGVGKTTFFRHFADRQSLLAALLDRATDELQEEAGRFGDAPDALLHIMAYLTMCIGERASFIAYWNAASPDHPVVRALFARVRPILDAAIARARDAGLCRADLTSADIIMLGRMMAMAANDAPPEKRVAVARRMATLLAEGYKIA